MRRKIHRFVKDDVWRIGLTQEVASDREQIICCLHTRSGGSQNRHEMVKSLNGYQ